ncbi:alpha/beta hydrolase [Alkalihalophilus pseudofirmus]|uniref:Alpha/beta hydrolase n=1 Tax=Alkalihalophilus pseudofirmus TaxID=79885 RepID=A0AAJ2KU24_ALKPS|nr:alpha/beta hydrolase [Alkalihalophilus pseudofirmus]MDV2885102.1 alpha/beta hydrolase [Alkalihalophilus pseudofirmus]
MLSILKKCKYGVLISILTINMLALIVVLSVHAWTYTEAGKVPPKTAVLLHAVHHNLVPADMKPPKFFVQGGSPSFTRENISIPVTDGSEIPARMYRPIKGEGHPIILYYHGGAFMKGYGDINTHDNIVRSLAARTKSIVIAVGYRVAPEHPFPAAIEDSYDAFVWAVSEAENLGGDPSKVAVVGDSAGGNLATVVSLMARDRNGPDIAAQALLYPLTTFQDVEFDSRGVYDSGYYLLSRNVMLRARDTYTPEKEMWKLPYTSPLEADDLYKMPPALVITAEFDPLRDEGEAYAKRLAEHGVSVRTLRYNGVMHGFISFYEVMYRGNHGLNQTAAFLNQVFEEAPHYEPYHLHVYEGVEQTNQFREEAEAYAIGSFLLGRQALSMMPFTQ